MFQQVTSTDLHAQSPPQPSLQGCSWGQTQTRGPTDSPSQAHPTPFLWASRTWYVMGPVVVTVGAAWFGGGLEVLGHTRQMHPNATRLAALTLKQERPMTVEYVSQLHKPSESCKKMASRLKGLKF